MAFGFGLFDHLTIVFANDYADRDADARADSRTIFSGGSRVIPDGVLPARAVERAAIACAALLAIGSAAAGHWIDRPLLPAFAAAALALLAMYSFPPLALSYRGHGEILQGIGVGLVLPLLGFYVQTGALLEAPWDAFAPLVVLAFASNILTALPDLEADAAAGKRTWPVRRGATASRRDAVVLIGLGIALTTQVGPDRSMAWLAVAIGPAALCALVALWLSRRRDALLPFVAAGTGATVALQLAWSVALFFGDAGPRALGT